MPADWCRCRLRRTCWAARSASSADFLRCKFYKLPWRDTPHLSRPSKPAGLFSLRWSRSRYLGRKAGFPWRPCRRSAASPVRRSDRWPTLWDLWESPRLFPDAPSAAKTTHPVWRRWQEGSRLADRLLRCLCLRTWSWTRNPWSEADIWWCPSRRAADLDKKILALPYHSPHCLNPNGKLRICRRSAPVAHD